MTQEEQERQTLRPVYWDSTTSSYVPSPKQPESFKIYHNNITGKNTVSWKHVLLIYPKAKCVRNGSNELPFLRDDNSIE
jgi:phage terminase large subunit-like protein